MTKLSRPDVVLDNKALIGVVVDDVTTIKGMERPDVYLGKKAHKVILVNPDGTPYVGGGGSGPVTWGSIIGKPSTFPPSAHEHDISDVNGLQAELANHSTRIQNLEDTIPDDIVDGETIITENGKLVVKSIAGVEVTTDEINALKGVTENVQQQINALSNVGNFSTTVDTYAELSSLNVSNNDMVIVLEDETKNGASTIYIYNGNEFVFAGEFKGGEIRDFTTNPIDLQTETTNILPKTRYEKQNASETAFIDSSGKITATNVQDAIKQTYAKAEQSSSGGITVVDNLTSTSTTSALSANMGRVLNEKIEQLEVGGSVSWENIENKPTKFPPTSHSHSVSDITGLQAELNSLKSRISELELEVDLLKNGTDDKVLQYLVKERIITNVIDEPRKGMVDVVQYPDDLQIGENFIVELKEV
ncbi:MAG: hypothetical protein GX664_04210 [Bacteroidales bacterium]|nr:hypothetical protein [Bacteroidales bacterium]